MKCPKCGGEIPFYDIKPNCRHCGVNILYYTQDDDLIRDAKRTELESAVARMIVAKIKAVFIGSKLAIIRMIGIVAAICAMMVPFCSVSFSLPYYEEKFSVSLIGIIQGITGGLLLKLPSYLKSTLFSSAGLACILILAVFLLLVLADLAMFAVYILSAISPNKSAKILKRISIAAVVISLLAFFAALYFSFTLKGNSYFAYTFGFGSLVNALIHIFLCVINTKMLKKGIEPQYREFDPKRKALLKRVRKGEVDIDELPLPIFESDEEREKRLNAFMEQEANS